MPPAGSGGVPGEQDGVFAAIAGRLDDWPISVHHSWFPHFMSPSLISFIFMPMAAFLAAESDA